MAKHPLIKNVILYKHGMGYFECLGQVTDADSLELEFKKEEMNDVLKSLAVYDTGGGTIQSISCDAGRSAADELAAIALEIPQTDSLSGLLQSLRGTPVQVALMDASPPISGAVIGLEQNQQGQGEVAIDIKRLVLWTADGALRHIPLIEIKGIEILDEKARADLQKILETIPYWKGRDLKKLTIFTRGAGQRQIQLSYSIPAPVWKTSYRILLKEDGTPYLQGWAHVDNTGETDWQDVQLSLVAGLPVSFIHDLYSPRYRQRPEIEIVEEAAYGAPVVQQGVYPEAEMDLMIGDMPVPAPAAEAAAGFSKAKQAPSRSRAMQLEMRPGERMDLESAMGQQNQVSRHKMEMADLYMYTIENPVTVKRGQSAMVPILGSDLKGEQLALYNQKLRAGNPMTVLRLENNTELVLEGGPVTLYKSGEYLGEAMLDTLKSGQKALLPYAVELACRINIDHKSRERGVYRIQIYAGTLHLSWRTEKKTIYTINNQNGERPLKLLLDHPITKTWDLDKEMPQPVETTDDYYRFELQIPAGKAFAFPIVELGSRSSQTQVLDLDGDDLRRYFQLNYFTDGIKTSLQAIQDIQLQLEKLTGEKAVLDEDYNELFENQKRIRENLKALGERAEELELRKKYLAQLHQDEEKLAAIKDRQKETRQQHESLQQERDLALEQLSWQSDLA
ncbi:MAG: hypothetical protein KDK39_11845 [Leptospiraceae bacterium]|nr:hypothetical protein [Leptospiraceae bacterium]